MGLQRVEFQFSFLCIWYFFLIISLLLLCLARCTMFSDFVLLKRSLVPSIVSYLFALFSLRRLLSSCCKWDSFDMPENNPWTRGLREMLEYILWVQLLSIIFSWILPDIVNKESHYHIQTSNFLVVISYFVSVFYIYIYDLFANLCYGWWLRALLSALPRRRPVQLRVEFWRVKWQTYSTFAWKLRMEEFGKIQSMGHSYQTRPSDSHFHLCLCKSVI